MNVFCRKPYGFGFIQYLDLVHAIDAEYYMDQSFLVERKIIVVFVKEN